MQRQTHGDGGAQHRAAAAVLLSLGAASVLLGLLLGPLLHAQLHFVSAGGFIGTGLVHVAVAAWLWREGNALGRGD